ncbi:MAG: hypothetical protein IJ666_05550 [Ruminococcus sp.]|nr:hypothetical protein [Ruminococcus sp.]
MTRIRKICFTSAVCTLLSSVFPFDAYTAAAADDEPPTLQEIVEANNFVAYCDLYDSMYMDYKSDRDSCKAYYTENDGSSFYIKYNDSNEYEVVTPDYAVSSNGADGNAEYYLFRRSGDELMYRMSVAPEPRPRVILSSYISNVDTDEYNKFFEDYRNFNIEYGDGVVIWSIDYSDIDWLDGKDVYLLEPDNLTCRQFTYYDSEGNILSRWESEFNIGENPVPSSVDYRYYTEPQKMVAVELYSSDEPDILIKSWNAAAESTVSVYGETVYTDAGLKNKFGGKLGADGVQKLYIQESSLSKEHGNIFTVLTAITAVMIILAFVLEKIFCIKLKRKTGNDNAS